jgi:hypothetical protein
VHVVVGDTYVTDVPELAAAGAAAPETFDSQSSVLLPAISLWSRVMSCNSPGVGLYMLKPYWPFSSRQL